MVDIHNTDPKVSHITGSKGAGLLPPAELGVLNPLSLQFVTMPSFPSLSAFLLLPLPMVMLFFLYSAVYVL